MWQSFARPASGGSPGPGSPRGALGRCRGGRDRRADRWRASGRPSCLHRPLQPPCVGRRSPAGGPRMRRPAQRHRRGGDPRHPAALRAGLKDQRVATVKIIPFAVPADVIDAWRQNSGPTPAASSSLASASRGPDPERVRLPRPRRCWRDRRRDARPTGAARQPPRSGAALSSRVRRNRQPSYRVPGGRLRSGIDLGRHHQQGQGRRGAGRYPVCRRRDRPFRYARGAGEHAAAGDESARYRS